MKIIDISWPISETITAYKDKKTVQFTKLKAFENDAVRESKITLGSHTGTHVDAPAHFLKDGSMIDTIGLERLIGKARVLDCVNVSDKITRKDLEFHEIKAAEIILLKTRNSQKQPTDLFDQAFVSLDVSGAEYLIKKQIKAVGIDYLGIERGDPEHKTHTLLMKAGVVIIEGLRLFDAPFGSAFFICLPLAIEGLEAAPARAILTLEKHTSPTSLNED